MNKDLFEYVLEELRKIQEIDLKYDWNMAKEVSFRAGGNVCLFITPKTLESLKETIKCLKKYDISIFVMGNGSNFFVTDKGFDGAVIKISEEYFGDIIISENKMSIGAGALMRNIGVKAMENSLTGFEFASGIPGSFGGAIFMNAGAYGGEMKDIVHEVTALNTETMEVEYIKNENLEFAYRDSVFHRRGYVILGGTIKLQQGIKEEISFKMKDLLDKRNSKQPVQYPSAGSFFKRPTGYFAGKLIEDAGLKGYAVGGAQVAEKHSGFIINKNKAKAKDILELMVHCQTVVFEKFGVKLEPEVRILGEK